jgi:multimeric flavodoxin WrbA
MKEADAWVIGTPIYMGHVSGQLKLCLDRVYGFMGPNRANRLPPGKKAVIAITQGMQDPEAYKNVAELLFYTLSRRGVSVRSIVAGGMSSAMAGSALTKDVEDEAKAAGAWLAQAS